MAVIWCLLKDCVDNVHGLCECGDVVIEADGCKQYDPTGIDYDEEEI